MAEEKPEEQKNLEQPTQENGNGKEETAKAVALAQNIIKGETVKDTEIVEEMKKAYIDYAMSVIVARALPSVEDGLKPVQRRILYSMEQIGLQHNKPTKKSARIVGDCMGKYHPHGDMAIYDALVRMAQPFSLRYPLIVGQGNFGSIDGDPAAAMRYCVSGDSLIITENGLQKINGLSNIEDINIKILSKDKKINRASKWFDSGEHETIRITTNKGYSLTGSKNHPILTLTTNRFGRPAFMWKLLGNVTEGDIAVIDRREDSFWPEKEIDLRTYYPKIRNNRQHLRILPRVFNKNLGFILGLLISEGSISKNKIEFCNVDASLIKEFESKWSLVFPDSTLHKFKRNPSSYGKQEYFRLECHCRYTIEFLRNIGLEAVKSNQKDISILILRSPKEIIASFLKAYFEGDGGINYSEKMIELSCCSKSEELIKKLQILLLRFGIESAKRYDKYKFIHKLFIRGQRNILRFYKEIGFFSERKKKKLEFVILNYKKDYSSTDYVPFLSDFIRKISGYSGSEFVIKHNFDRYPNMKKNYQKIVSIILQKTGIDYSSIFEYFLTYHYLFDPIIKLENAGIQKVYSIKVNSECHSFISNGFISHNTEAKLQSIAEELLQDIDKKTVKMQANFDNTLQEPELLPGKLPNLLINGATGIAVGMATSIPPHNVTEVIDGITAYIKNSDVTIKDLMKYIQGPDFPTAGFIHKDGIADMYNEGRGSITLRGKTSIEKMKGERERIIISELPYQTNKAELIKTIAKLVQEKKLEDISDIRDESAKDQIRIVLLLKRGANSKLIVNKLYKLTVLETKFHAILLALAASQPKILNLKQLIEYYVKHRQKIVRKRTEYDLKVAEDREHILIGLIIALRNLDPVIALIKKSKGTTEATKSLTEKYKLSQKQAQAILEMKLQKLTVLEQDKLKKEHEETKKKIEEFKKILGSEQEILDIIKQELQELRRKYGDARKTRIIERLPQVKELDLIKKEQVAVILTSKGYVKRMALRLYQEQRRGGKGITGTDLTTGDFVQSVFICSTHDYILFLTERGLLYMLKAYDLPEATRYSKGKALVNLLHITDKIKGIIPLTEKQGAIFIVTKAGIAKRVDLENFVRIKKSGVKAASLPLEDGVVDAKLISEEDEVIIATKKGIAARFAVKQIRKMGKAAYGVAAIKLAKDDEVIGFQVLNPEQQKDSAQSILTLTEKGYGKRSAVSDYRKTARACKGIININCSERNGNVKGISLVTENDSVILTTAKGMVIRVPCKDIRVMGRNTQGVRIIRLRQGDGVTDLVKVQ